MSALIRTESNGEILTVYFTQAKILDEAVIQQISSEMVDLISRTEEPNLLLDFGQVRFMSSSALGMLVKVNKKCKEFKITLKLCNIQKDILEVFRITRLDKVFSIYPDAASALEGYKKSGLFFRK